MSCLRFFVDGEESDDYSTFEDDYKQKVVAKPSSSSAGSTSNNSGARSYPNSPRPQSLMPLPRQNTLSLSVGNSPRQKRLLVRSSSMATPEHQRQSNPQTSPTLSDYGGGGTGSPRPRPRRQASTSARTPYRNEVG